MESNISYTTTTSSTTTTTTSPPVADLSSVSPDDDVVIDRVDNLNGVIYGLPIDVTVNVSKVDPTRPNDVDTCPETEIKASNNSVDEHGASSSSTVISTTTPGDSAASIHSSQTEVPAKSSVDTMPTDADVGASSSYTPSPPVVESPSVSPDDDVFEDQGELSPTSEKAPAMGISIPIEPYEHSADAKDTKVLTDHDPDRFFSCSSQRDVVTLSNMNITTRIHSITPSESDSRRGLSTTSIFGVPLVPKTVADLNDLCLSLLDSSPSNAVTSTPPKPEYRSLSESQLMHAGFFNDNESVPDISLKLSRCNSYSCLLTEHDVSDNSG